MKYPALAHPKPLTMQPKLLSQLVVADGFGRSGQLANQLLRKLHGACSATVHDRRHKNKKVMRTLHYEHYRRTIILTVIAVITRS